MHHNTPDSCRQRNSGIRLAVAAAGLVLLALFILPGWAATGPALGAHEMLKEAGNPPAVAD